MFKELGWSSVFTLKIFWTFVRDPGRHFYMREHSQSSRLTIFTQLISRRAVVSSGFNKYIDRAMWLLLIHHIKNIVVFINLVDSSPLWTLKLPGFFSSAQCILESSTFIILILNSPFSNVYLVLSQLRNTDLFGVLQGGWNSVQICNWQWKFYDNRMNWLQSRIFYFLKKFIWNNFNINRFLYIFLQLVNTLNTFIHS